MSMAHFSRNHCKPLIKRDDLALPHQRGNRECIGLARFTQHPPIDLCERNRGHNEVAGILNRLFKPIGVGATYEELDPSGRIDYGRHRSSSR